MNKKLMAVAVAGALAVPGLAFAQAASVQIYGVLDLRADNMKFSASTVGLSDGTTKNHLFSSGSRWGLRGSEDLGGGLSAFFQLESGIPADGRPLAGIDTGGVNTFGGRDTFLGLRSTSWGAVQGGGFSTPYLGVTSIWNVVPTLGHGQIIMGNGDTTGGLPSPNCVGIVSPAGFLATVGTVTIPAIPAGAPAGAPAVAVAVTTTPGSTCASNGVEGGQWSFARRQSDQIQYTSPVINGFVFRASTAFAEWEANSNAPINPGVKASLYSYSLSWSGGPFSVAGGYETHNKFAGLALDTAVINGKDTGVTVGGRWNYGKGLLGAGFERLKYGAGSTSATAGSAFQLDNWVINGTYNITPRGVVSAAYSRTAGGKSCGPTAPVVAALGGVAACGDAGKASNVTLAYDHSLSKRTGIYAVYGRINNGSGSRYYYVAGPTSNAFGGDIGGATAGVDVTTYAVGVKHSF